MMDQQANQNSLLSALHQKGYAVHILSTTTINENRVVVDNLPPPDQGRNRGDENDRENKGQQQRRNQR
jgi:hypothetical protein